jgi:hypothetical protein
VKYHAGAPDGLGGFERMQAKMIVFPSEDGFNVLVLGKSASDPMRVRSFDNRASMIALLENLQLLTLESARELENFDFLNSCPLYTSDVDEATLEAHGFRRV